MEIQFTSAYEIICEAFRTIQADTLVTTALPKREILKVLDGIEKFHTENNALSEFRVKYDRSLINFALSLAYSFHPIVFCSIDEFRYNLHGCAYGLENKIPLLVIVLIPCSYKSKDIEQAEDLIDSLAAVVSKAVFRLKTSKEIMQVLIAATVVSRSREGGPAPVVVTIRSDVFSSHATLNETIKNPAFNEDLDLISTPLDDRLFYKTPTIPSIELSADIEKCRWLHGMLSLHSMQASIFMDFSSYIESGDSRRLLAFLQNGHAE